jgi:hypothetical protein
MADSRDASSPTGEMLAILLDGVSGLDQFVRRISLPGTFMTFNPIFEFCHFQRSGAVA